MLNFFSKLQLPIFFILFSTSCVSSSDGNVNTTSQITDIIAKDISVEEFKKLISDTSIILDVRTKDEFKSGHIKNAVNIDYFSDSFLEEVSKLDKTKTLLVYCASGGRSSKSMASMKTMGFVKIYNMLGGMGAWKNTGFPVIK